TWRARHAVSLAPDIRVISSPATVTLPSEGTSRPPSKLSKVVLPEPLGPMNATKSPASTSRLSPCSTWISSPPRRYVFPRPRARIRLLLSPRPSILTMALPISARPGRRGPTICDARCSLDARLGQHGSGLPLHADGLTLAELLGSGGDDLLAVGEAGDDLLIASSYLADSHRAPFDLAVAVHEDRRRAALVDQRRAGDQDASGRGRRAPFLAEEGHLDAHVRQDARIQPLEGRP